MYSKNSGIARRLSLHGVSVFALQLGLYSKYINDIRFNYFYISQFFFRDNNNTLVKEAL